MKLITVAYKYLKPYSFVSAAVLFSIIMMSLFDGISLGMLVPLIQSMTNEDVTISAIAPFSKYLRLPSFSSGQIGMISLIFILIFFVLTLKNIFTYISDVLIAKLRYGIMKDLRVKLMGNLLKYDLKYFDRTNTGYIIGNINSETQRMGNFILAILTFSTLAGRVFIYTVILFLISWKISLIVFFLIAVILLLIESIMVKVKALGVKISEAIAEYNYKLTEILNGIRIIKTCGTEENEGDNFEAVAEKERYFEYKSSKTLNLIAPLAEIMIFGLLVSLFLILIKLTRIDIAKTFPFIAAYLLILARSLTQLNAMNRFRSAAINNLAAFLSYENIYDPAGKATIKSGARRFSSLSGSIEFQDVDFSYDIGKPILRNFSIRISKGEMTALVGKSGAGKSTVVNLILRFYEPNSGTIVVDGEDLRTLNLKDWRGRIGFVSQDIFIFNTTVKQNISYGFGGLLKEEAVTAAKAANAHDFIMNLPNGYDTILGERGIKLSEGQRQRISIARAIMHNPEILILDEATSSLDTQTESLIRDAIDRLTKDRTVIAIAHRLSTVVHADNIIVLDNGAVVESGTHKELVQREGYYRKLYDAQFKI